MAALVSANSSIAILLPGGLLIYAFIWLAARRLPPWSRALARLAPLLLLGISVGLYASLGLQSLTRARSPLPTAHPGSVDGPQSYNSRAAHKTQPTVAVPQQEPNTPPAPRVGAGAPTQGAEPKASGAPAQATPDQPVAPPTEWDVVPVLYGTDRNRTEDKKRPIYGGERAHRLELGRALITVPKSHQVPNIERPFALRIPFLNVTVYEQAEDPRLHFTVKEMSVVTQEQFIALARQRVGGSQAFKDQALIFVHGYNTSFDFALYRTAQMAYDLQFDGASFLYSWPSAEGLTTYGYDRESSLQAEPYLRKFIELVVKETGAQSVSLIAHSMGNLPLLQVLRDLGPTLPPGVRLNQIILAAPDVDRDVFAYLAANIKQYGRGITLYASSNDRAMAAARRMAGGVPRAGDVPADGPIVVDGIDTIDVSETSTDYLALNHSSYAEKSALLNDIGLLLQTGERPPDRRIPTLMRIQSPNGAFWRYPMTAH